MGGPGASTGAGTKVGVTLKLPQLQNLCKRDPQGYREDYDAQVRRLESELGILALQPQTEPSKSLIELIQFAAAVSSSSYKGKEADRIASMLLSLLVGTTDLSNGEERPSNAAIENVSSLPTAALQLHREVRKSCVSALILMRNKGAVQPLQLLEPFFRLMATIPDKGLRTQLHKHIVNDIRNLNKKGKRDEKVNRSIQSFLHRVVNSHGMAEVAGADPTAESATDIAAKRATEMVCELYRRRVWTDDRAVAILASAVESRNATVMCRAIRFFLGIEEKMAEDSKQKEQEKMDKNNSIDYHLHSKKTKAHQRQVTRDVKNRKKEIKKREEEDWQDIAPEDDKGVEASKKLFPAIELLRDPQGMAESVFKRLRGVGSIKYDQKILMINFVTRLVGNHELLLLPLYPFLQKYMGGQQRNVTAVLAYTVQACHEQVPPDEVYGILKTIAHNFIAERCSEEQMAVGINAVRAICSRVPSVLSIEESAESTGTTTMDVEAFARDLAAFGNHRDRSVSIAAKGWTNFIRETSPGLLQGKHRGLQGTALHKSGAKPLRYGQSKVASGVEGADLLAAYEARKAERKRNGEGSDTESGSDSDDAEEGDWEETMKGDEDASDNEEEDEMKFEEEGAEIESEDEEAPTLVNLDKQEADEKALELSKMSVEEREKLKSEMSASRIFTARDFDRMRKLVAKEQRMKMDPRENARRKRAIARGLDPDDLSDDSDSDEEAPVKIAGAVNPEDIMAHARKKRQNKAERLEKALAGRSQFEFRDRDGGSTNIEKKRKKNFLMTKFSRDARSKGKGKGGLNKKQYENKKKTMKHEARKRRRKV